jgi:hypothetical protein
MWAPYTERHHRCTAFWAERATRRGCERSLVTVIAITSPTNIYCRLRFRRPISLQRPAEDSACAPDGIDRKVCCQTRLEHEGMDDALLFTTGWNQCRSKTSPNISGQPTATPRPVAIRWISH